MDSRIPSVRNARHPIHLTIGFTVWMVWFSLAYGGLSVACAAAARPLEQGPWTWVNAVLIVFTLATAAGLGAASFAAWRAARRVGEGEHASGRDRFMATGAAVLYLAAAVSTLAVGAPLLLLPPCL